MTEEELQRIKKDNEELWDILGLTGARRDSDSGNPNINVLAVQRLRDIDALVAEVLRLRTVSHCVKCGGELASLLCGRCWCEGVNGHKVGHAPDIYCRHT